MKFLTFINPVRRQMHGTGHPARAASSAMKRSHRRTYRRRISRNPPKMTPFMKAKISRAIKAAHRRGVYREGGRAKSRAIVVAPRRTTTRTRTIVRRGGTRTVVVRSSSRRRAGLAPARLTGIMNVFNQQTLTIAAGAATAGVATSYILTQFGRNLPGVATPIGNALYRVGIPVGLAWATRRFSRNFSDGLVIGGMVMLVNMLIGQFLTPAAPAPAATSAYPVSPASPLAGMGEYLDPVGESVFDSNTAFATDAWA